MGEVVKLRIFALAVVVIVSLNGCGSSNDIASTPCQSSGTSCAVGDTGPGGGIVFFDSGANKAWGRYLEAAPVGWNGAPEDPVAQWCPEYNGDFGEGYVESAPPLKTRDSVGAGKTNTKRILDSGCTGAAALAKSYRGGGKNDWFLMSYEEGDLMLHEETAPGGGAVVPGLSPNAGGPYFSGTYWTSSAQDDGYATSGGTGVRVDRERHVRPIRAFGPTNSS
jgi:hypothetical protein